MCHRGFGERVSVASRHSSSNRSFPGERPLGPWLRLLRVRLSARRNGFNDPQKALSLPTPSRPEPTAPDASPVLSPRNRPVRHTMDARRRRLDRFVKRGEPQPEAHASRSRPIRSRIAANNWRGTATSANWKVTYLACLTTFAPILTSFSRNVVRFQPRIDRGSANCRSAFARLYAKANNCKRAWSSLNRRQGSFVHFTAFLPSF